MGGCAAYLDRRWGWVVTAASFMMYLVSCGSLGVFVLLYVYFQREFHDSAVATGWIGSLGNGLLNLMSFVSSPLYERFSRRKIIILGVVLSSAGMLATSFTQALWQNYLTFGIIFATGLNFISNPSVNMITAYFPGRNCARATTLGNSGQTVGTLLLTPLFEATVSLIGWRRSLQIFAAVIFLTCLPLAMVFKPPPPPPPPPPRSIKLDISSAERGEMKMINLGNTPQEEHEAELCKQTQKCNDCDLSNARGGNGTSSEDRLENGLVEIGTTAENVEPSETESCTLLRTDEDRCPTSEATTTSIVPLNDEEVLTAKSKSCEDDNTIHGRNMKKDYKPWRKYVRLAKHPRHVCFFVGTSGAAVTIVFNGIHLVSCMTTGGIPESTAAWLITLLCVFDLVFRLILAFTGDHLPMKRIVLLAIAAGFGAVGSFLLTRGTALWIFVVYCFIAGFVRCVIFGFGFACVVELFGADRAVETLTSTQIAYGIGGLLASSIAGLSYDITGTYQTTHYTCMGLWTVSCILYVIVYKWRQITSCWSNTNHAQPM